jgi:cytochrome c556
MDILEGVYVDAKTSSSRETMELMAWMLADGAGQIALDQEDAAWRRQSAEVVAAARAVAAAAANGETDLKSVRESLKTVRAKCDVCHDASRR